MCAATCSCRGEIELDAVARVVERVEHADVAMPADAEHVGDLVLDQVLRDQLGTLHARHRKASRRAQVGLGR